MGSRAACCLLPAACHRCFCCRRVCCCLAPITEVIAWAHALRLLLVRQASTLVPLMSLTTLSPLQPKSGTPYVVWPVMWDYLQQKRLRSIGNAECRALQAKGAVLLDVRLREEFDRCIRHPLLAVLQLGCRLRGGSSGSYMGWSSRPRGRVLLDVRRREEFGRQDRGLARAAANASSSSNALLGGCLRRNACMFRARRRCILTAC